MNFPWFRCGVCAFAASSRVAVILLRMLRFVPRHLLSSALAALLCMLTVTPSFAWGPDGHRIVNRLAAEKLPTSVPEFLRTQAAIDEIEYLGPEPDRWRSANEAELNAEQAPEHFIDLELADMVGKLPRRRYDFIAALYATGLTHPDEARDLRPEKVGLQPWVANEVYERLQAALREYREQSARHEDTKDVEASAIFYAGWLGHYVGDGSMPLHTTVNYNGWVGKENPNQYVTSPGIHSQWESTFVHNNLKAADAEPFIAPVKTLNDPFEDYVAYLRASNGLVERVYQLEKVQGFDGAGTAESRQFTAQRLAAGASELRDMIVTAWEKSATPVPPYHPAPPVPRATTPRTNPY
jgi:S1/P1 Nuclease